MIRKKTNTKASPKRKTKRKAAKSGRGLGKYLFFLGLKLSLVFAAAFSLYGIYLDNKIKEKFEGQLWTLPAQVFARPLTLYPGMEISKQEVVRELKLLNYRYAGKPKRSGEYAQSKFKLEVVRRPFDFADGHEGQKRFQVAFKNNRVTQITLLPSGKKLGYVRLDPLLIDRLNTSNNQDRMLVKRDGFPDLLVNTLLLVEDRDFYHHDGVSPLAILRALMANIKAGHTVQGGSTLTQQLAKNFFLSQQRTLWRKFQEAYMALIIDYRYSKDQVLEAYLNEVYLGQNGADGVYGFGLASHFYFGRPVSELAPGQIALLVALVKGPSFYDPWRRKERAVDRRDLVLRLMAENGLLDKAAYQYAVKQKTVVIKRGEMRKQTTPSYLSLVRRELNEKLGDRLNGETGLKIFTALDPMAQKSAENAISQGIKKLEKERKLSGLEGAMVVTDKRKGEVIALVGGREVKFAGFNRALDAQRPIGSLVKPAVFLTALEGPYSLASILEDKPVALKNKSGQVWKPKNYDKKFHGQVMLYEALMNSYNVPTVNLGMAVGLDNVVNTLHQMGVEKKIKPYPSLVLGSLSLSPLEVSQMYQTLVAQGVYQPLVTIRTVLDRDGNEIYQKNVTAEARLDKAASYLTLYNLNLVTQKGTARSLSWRLPKVKVGGKTGTTNELRDSWFVGWDNRDLVTSWIGKDDNKPAGLTGSSGALQLFSRYMKERSAKSYQLPLSDSINWAHFDKVTGQNVASHCDRSVSLPAEISKSELAKGCSGQKTEGNSNWLSRIFGM